MEAAKYASCPNYGTLAPQRSLQEPTKLEKSHGERFGLALKRTRFGATGPTGASRTASTNARSCATKSDNKKKGIIHKILVGDVSTSARLAHLPVPPCSEECPCGLGRETL